MDTYQKRPKKIFFTRLRTGRSFVASHRGVAFPMFATVPILKICSRQQPFAYSPRAYQPFFQTRSFPTYPRFATVVTACRLWSLYRRYIKSPTKEKYSFVGPIPVKHIVNIL